MPACSSCNTSKCNDEVTGWLRRKRLDERSFLLRHVELRLALGRAGGTRTDPARAGTQRSPAWMRAKASTLPIASLTGLWSWAVTRSRFHAWVLAQRPVRPA